MVKWRVEMKYTKGEWKAEESNRETVLGDVLYYIEANDDVVAHEIETLANAQLIASAPRMHKALEDTLEASHNPVVEKILMEALAKVEGKDV
jgi:phage tail tube protein FII